MEAVNFQKQIQPWQIKKLWAISRSLGIDKDELYTMGGVDSLHELTAIDAGEIIRRLEKQQGGFTPQKKSKKVHEEIAGGVTASQQQKIWALMYLIKRYDMQPVDTALGERLCGVIRKHLSIDCLPIKPFQFLDQQKGMELIEILKRFAYNAEVKYIKEKGCQPPP